MNHSNLRERSFDEVLLLIEQYKNDIGVSRIANITHLDNIGIPVYCSYRPKSLLLQANSGKGLSHKQAKCSAWMEALEYMHIEKQPTSSNTKIESQESLCKGEANVLTYQNLGALQSPFFSPHLPISWISLYGLNEHDKYWCPMDMVYLCNRSFVSCHTNGLSSGNTNNESILHGILEVVERDAYAQLYVNGKLSIRDVGNKIHLDTIRIPVLSSLVGMIRSAGSYLYLILLPSSIPVYSFWAVIIDEFSPVPVGSFNFGLGCHPDPVVASVRAITEAAQSRLVYIHGNREDIRHEAVFSNNYSIPVNIYSFFKNLDSYHFSDLCSMESPCKAQNVDSSLSLLIEQLQKNGFCGLYTHVLRDESLTFSVTKTFIPGMRLETRFL